MRESVTTVEASVKKCISHFKLIVRRKGKFIQVIHLLLNILRILCLFIIHIPFSDDDPNTLFPLMNYQLES